MASTSTPHAYTAEPAIPTLAHSLIPHSQTARETPWSAESSQPSHPHYDTKSWNLKDEIEKGFQDGSGIFQTGTVMGFSKLRNMNMNMNNENNQDDVDIGQVCITK
ncbi:hypothetical protein BO71DRAFT_401017 [Aspergillus ellipticus CBS 707.79]|uniref:Uncharacterized protein n=1 Tax=Aspergillus ellipticus CBS 707.79 TaxID=1448320 RepID=A0A319D420_9EURO|nr:hypothetical protein BO71DRAFT_401017 [Aspergillus ellipticus CBS 707.79]